MDQTTLVRMANQIARNLTAQGDEPAIAQTVRHLRDFWDPRMLAEIKQADPSALDPIARAAVARL